MFIVRKIARHFVAVFNIWVVKGIVPVVEGINNLIIILYAVDYPITGPEHPI